MRHIHGKTGIALLIAGAIVSDSAAANQRIRFPQEILPNFYTSVPIEALHDDEWAAIPFWRPPECVRAEFNLLDYFDDAAVDCPLLVEGFALFNERGPILTEARGLGAVLIWFARWPELHAATQDGMLTIGELASLPSLLAGTADTYNEQNHIYGIHQVSHFALAAHGELEDGRTLRFQVVEVDLELVRVLIDFE